MKIGDTVLVRTVTYHHIGIVAEIDDRTVTLRPAAWLADSGRWTHALLTGEVSEVEPDPDGVTIWTQSIVDVVPWRHDVPIDAK